MAARGTDFNFWDSEPPTNHNSRRSPAGFEDQARHQTGSTRGFWSSLSSFRVCAFLPPAPKRLRMNSTS